MTERPDHREDRAMSPDRYDVSRHTARAMLVVLTMLAAWLRLRGIASWELFGDEVGTLRWLREPLSEILSRYTHQLTMHLFIVIEKGVAILLGESAVALRLTSVAAGIATVPSIYWLARSCCRRTPGGRATALMAAALAATSSPLVAYSANARVYALSTLVWIACGAIAARATLTHRARPWLWFSPLAILALLLSLQGVPMLAAQTGAATLILVRSQARWRERLGPILAAGAAVALAALFYLPLWNALLTHLSNPSAYHRIPLDLGWIPPTWSVLSEPLGWLLLPAGAAAALLLWRRSAAGRFLILWWFIPWLTPFLYLVESPPGELFHARFLLPTMAPLIVLGAFSLEWIHRHLALLRRLGPVMFISLVTLLSLLLPSSLPDRLLRAGPPYSRFGELSIVEQGSSLWFFGPSFLDRSLRWLFPDRPWLNVKTAVALAASATPGSTPMPRRLLESRPPWVLTVVMHVKRQAQFEFTQRAGLEMQNLEDPARPLLLVVVRATAPTRKALREALRAILIDYTRNVSRRPVTANPHWQARLLEQTCRDLARLWDADGEPARAAAARRAAKLAQGMTPGSD